MVGARLRKVARFVLPWAVLGAVTLGVTRKVDWSHAVAGVASVPGWAVAAAVAGLAASYLFRALRMRSELARGTRVPLRRFLTLMVVHNAAVNVVPMRGGDAAYPLLVHRWLGIPPADAVGSLVWMRVQDALVLALLGVSLWPELPLPLRCGGAAAVVAAMLLATRLVRLASGWARSEGRGGSAQRALRAAAEALARAPDHGLAGWAFCLASWTCKLAAIALCLAATAHLAPFTALVATLGGELAGTIPLQGPAGFGTYEAGVWAAAALDGARAPEIAVAAAAVHLVFLSTALVAGALGHLAQGRVAGAVPLNLPEALP